jgi:hypothetical protein
VKRFNAKGAKAAKGAMGAEKGKTMKKILTQRRRGFAECAEKKRQKI